MALQLQERDGELAALRALLAEAQAGSGALALVEGPAGIGKTSVLRALRAGAPCRVLAAAGAELERDFGFGVVEQLFGAVVRSGEAALEEAVAPVFDASAAPVASHAILNGLFWLTAELAPVLIVVDDAHWVDEPSLHFLEFLARRVEDLPILLVLGERPGEAGQTESALERLAAAAHRFTLEPLTGDAVGGLLEDALGVEPEAGFVAASLETTGGNPMLVGELGRAMRAQGVTGTDADAQAARSAVPGSLVRAVTARLHRQGEHALRVAHALSVLGDHTRADRVARLSELPVEVVEQVIDDLVRVELLSAERLAFIHPMVREAIAADVRMSSRARLHRRAAEILQADGEREEVIAPHLLQAEPAGDAASARILRRAGERAAAEGAPELALRLLRRAYEEPPGPAERDAVLLALGAAEMRTGAFGAALEHLESVAAAEDPALAAEAELARAGILNLLERHPESAVGLAAGLAALGDRDGELAVRLTEQLIDTQAYVPELVPERTAFLEALDPVTAPPPLLAHLAFLRAVTGAPKAEVIAIAQRATGDGALLDDFHWGRSTPYWVSEALASVEAAPEHRALMQAMTRAAGRTGSEFAAAYVAVCRSHGEWRFGDLRRAEEEGRAALAAFLPTGVAQLIVYCITLVAQAVLDQGDVEAAGELLDDLTVELPRDTGAHAIRARVRLAQGRAQEALDDVDSQFARERAWGWRTTPREHPRATKVMALAALGRIEEARALADETLALARSQAMDGETAMLLIARSNCELGTEALTTLEAAATVAAVSPMPLVHARAVTEYGSALRRAGKRGAARDVLKRARELAHSCGAAGLERRALEELHVAGARPQRVALSGRGALTASELRAAELAGQGLTNRQIAETLFVTLKTVELHLGRSYGKLGIRSRAQLPEALAAR